MKSESCLKIRQENGSPNPEIAVLLVPFLGQGHLNQLLHLTHRLTPYNIQLHYAGPTIHNHQAKLRIQGWDPETSSKIHFHDFELPTINSPPPNPSRTFHFPTHLESLFDFSLLLRQPVCKLLQELAHRFRRIVVIHDVVVGSVVQDAKTIPNAEVYAYVPSSALNLFMDSWDALPEKPFQIDVEVPASIPYDESCLSPMVAEFLRYQYGFINFQAGILYNSSRLIEGNYLQLLQRLPMYDKMKHLAIGPINPVVTKTRGAERRHGCLEWLDKQESDSVIYVAFGSSTSMTQEQIRNLAIGLENSGQKFIWVLRNADRSNIFAEGEMGKPQLPEGYEERLRNRGMVIRDWAPQLEILGHPSVGGFMSHCGWNSCSESISTGVPILAWPIHSEQPRNAILVTEVLRIGILVRDWASHKELVASNIIENAIRRLMASEEGAEIRKRAEELGVIARGSVAIGGASHTEMESFVAHITR